MFFDNTQVWVFITLFITYQCFWFKALTVSFFFNFLTNLNSAATSPLSDSKQCLKESTGSISVDISVTGNHLEIPRDNMNLLCPEAINQRRNSRRPSILPVG